eukprot:UC4_evm1s1386
MHLHCLYLYFAFTISTTHIVAAENGVQENIRPPKLWLWLSGSLDESLSQIDDHHAIVEHVSFGGFSCHFNETTKVVELKGSANKTLIERFSSKEIKSWPLIGCGDTNTLRKLFADPKYFISSAVTFAKESGFEGYNLDFEPYDGLSLNKDGIAYAKFLKDLADALHAEDVKVSIDYFTNVPIWNLAALNDTSVDLFISMDTYVQDNATFAAYAEIGRTYLDSARMGLGMCSQVVSQSVPFGPDPCGSDDWSEQMLEERFNYVKTLTTVRQFGTISMWVLPLNDLWWSALE